MPEPTPKPTGSPKGEPMPAPMSVVPTTEPTLSYKAIVADCYLINSLFRLASSLFFAAVRHAFTFSSLSFFCYSYVVC